MSQSRCCENFLKTLPDKLGCGYGGTFIRGDMFGVRLLGDKLGAKMVAPFIDVGCLFAQHGYFDTEIISKFASPEYLSEKQIRQSEKAAKYIQKWFMEWIAKRLGCKEKLDAKPYTWIPSNGICEGGCCITSCSRNIELLIVIMFHTRENDDVNR